MSDHSDTPVTVPASALPAQLASVVRSALLGVGAYMVGKGWISNDTAAAIVSVGLIVAPLVWSQFTARNAHAKAITMASNLPNRIATIK